MSKLSQDKIKKIKEQILAELYHQGLKPLFTAEIASSIIRDEEFVKELLSQLKKDNLVQEISKSSKGYSYSKWRRWQLTARAYEAIQKLS